MAKLYATRIISGKSTLEDVPSAFFEETKRILIEDYDREDLCKI